MSELDSYDKIVFVYNADSGAGNALLDYGKKYLQPNKYDCQLCMVTYGAFGMKSDWKKYFKSLDVETKFLHRDEYATAYPNSDIENFPVMIGLAKDGQQKVLIDSNEFNQINSLNDLKITISSL